MAPVDESAWTKRQIREFCASQWKWVMGTPPTEGELDLSLSNEIAYGIPGIHRPLTYQRWVGQSRAMMFWDDEDLLYEERGKIPAHYCPDKTR